MATDHRPQKQRHRHGCPPVPLRSTYGHPWRRRRSCTNKQHGPLSGGRSYTCTGPDNAISSPAGTRLPITPKFKISGTARYTAELGGTTKAYGQVNAAHQGSAPSEVRAGPAATIGELPAFSTVNLAFGVDWEKLNIELFASNVFDERGQISRFLQCGQCGQRPYVVPIQPRTIGLRVGYDF